MKKIILPGIGIMALMVSFFVFGKENSKRNPSSIGSSTVILNDIIYNVTKKDQVAPALDKIIELSKGDMKGEAPAAIYGAFASLLKPLKGIVYRFRFLVEPIDTVYLGVVNNLRTFKRNKDRRATHIDALFDYLVDPNPKEVILGQKGLFTSFAQFQDWYGQKLAPLITNKITTLEKYAGNSTEALFEYDAGLLVGKAVANNMTSQTVRYRKIMPAHLYLAIANTHRNMGIGYYLSSYNFEKLVDFMSEITKKTFVNKKVAFKTKYLSRVFDTALLGPNDTYHIFQERKFRKSKFLTRRDEDGIAETYLPAAMNSLRMAIKNRLLGFQAMEALANLPNQNSYFVNASLFVSRPGMTKAILKKRLALMGGDSGLGVRATTEFSDRVAGNSVGNKSGKSFKVDIAKIFDPSNSKLKDLKKVYANRFNPLQDRVGNDKKTWKWNYDYGKAVSWPDHTFGGVLPDTGNSKQFASERLIPLSRDGSTRLLQSWLRFFM